MSLLKKTAMLILQQWIPAGIEYLQTIQWNLR